MASPTENAVYSNGTINVCFNVTVDGPNSINKDLSVNTYQGDWINDSVWCPSRIYQTIQFYPYNFSIRGIPFGEHSLNFTAHVRGDFALANYSARFYSLEKTISVKFSMHSNPILTFLSFQNANSTTSSFPLNFTVDHPVTQMAYCLDGQEKVPLSGNTTLTGLPNGMHNVTVYATDEFGYTGASDTLFFNVNTPEFPVAPLDAASMIAIAAIVAAIGVLVFRRKHGKAALTANGYRKQISIRRRNHFFQKTPPLNYKTGLSLNLQNVAFFPK